MARTPDLVISTVPNRSGLYLCKQEGAAVRPLARFTRGEESVKEFVEWCVAAGIYYEDTQGKSRAENGGTATGAVPGTGSSGSSAKSAAPTGRPEGGKDVPEQ